MRLSTGLSAALAVIAGFYLDYMGTLESYSVVLFAAFAFGMMSSFFVSRMHEPRMQENGFSYRAILEPFQDRNFRNLMYFIATWSLAANMVLPFLAVYMYKVLSLGVGTVMVLTMVSQFSSIYFLRSLGELSDRYGNKPVIAVSGSVFAMSIFLWTFSTFPGPHRLTLPLLFGLHVLLGLSIGGINLCTLNIGAKLSPAHKSTSYLANLALVTALFSGLGALISGHMLDFFLERRLSLVVNWSDSARLLNLPLLDFTGYDFHFLFAFFIALFSLHRLVFVSEAGEAPMRVVRHELVSSLLRDLRGLARAAYTPLLNLSILYSPLLSYLARMINKK
jgi:MFS family permease